MRSLILSLFVLALAVLPASACINDREVIHAEKEFKSRYLEQAPQPEYQPQQEAPSPLLAMMGGGGVVLLAGAVLLGFVKTSKT